MQALQKVLLENMGENLSGHGGVTKSLQMTVNVITPFPLTNSMFNPSHLYIVGFWSLGGRQIVIDKITLE